MLTERTSSYLPLYFGKEGKAFGVSGGAFIRCCHSYESCMLNKEKIWKEVLGLTLNYHLSHRRT